MFTLNQIKYKLIDFFNSHAQINDVKYEKDSDFNAERQLTYPVANIDFREIGIQQKKLTYYYLIRLFSLTDPNVPSINDEIISDMVLIADDFCTWLSFQEGIEFNKIVSIQKFIDDTHDRVSGVVFRVALNVYRPQKDCAIPKKDS